MYKRLKIRSENKLTQEEFGQATGIGKIPVSKLKSSENNLSERTIKLICPAFNVNEHWLRTGKGSPFNPISPFAEIEFRFRI